MMGENRSTEMKTVDQQQENNQNIKDLNIKNVRLIFFDRHNDHDNHAFINQLQTIFQTIDQFNNVEQCIDFVTGIANEKVFMILSNSDDQQLVSRIHTLPQIDSIFIYYNSEERIDKDWIKSWPKIKDIFQQDTSLVESLRRTARQYDENSVSISVIKPDVDLKENLDQLDPTFIYTQMLKEILVEIKYNNQSITDLAQHIRKFYSDHESILNRIDQFEKTYKPELALRLYTTEPFIYSTLNRALRNLEVDTIIQMGIFIHDLDLNINKICTDEKANEGHESQFTVYRGQGISHEDFEKLQKSRGGLLSFNNFLSTSRNENISMVFAEMSAGDPNLVGIFFQIEINESLPSAPYADLSQISRHKAETEILFSMNTVFRIERIEQLDNTIPLWKVHLTITSDTDQELKALADYLRKETEQLTGWFRLVPLLVRLGQFEKAKQVCETLLQTTPNDHENASIYGQLGFIHDSLGDSRQAISWYKNALEIMFQFDLSDKKSLAYMCNNIGLAYQNLDERQNALLFLEKSLEISKEIFPSNHSSFGVVYNNIGSMYDLLGEQLKALDFFEKAVHFSKTMPDNHPDLALTYKNIAGLYKDRGDFIKALEFIRKALEIEKKTLPKDHPTFALTYNHFGNIYRNLGDFKQATFYYEKATRISMEKYGENHRDVVAAYGNICGMYLEIGEYSKAVSLGEKALEIGEKIFNQDHALLAAFYNIIGLGSIHLHKIDEALSFCQKSLDIFQKMPNSNPLNLANGYISVGGVYMTAGQHEEALIFFHKGRIIQEGIFPPNHPHLANTYTHIGSIYNDRHECDKALFFFVKGLIIRRNVLPQYHPMIMRSYMCLVETFGRMGQSFFPMARLSCEKALEIAQYSLSIGDEERETCEKTYKLMERVKNPATMTPEQILELLMEEEEEEEYSLASM